MRCGGLCGMRCGRRVAVRGGGLHGVRRRRIAVRRGVRLVRVVLRAVCLLARSRRGRRGVVEVGNEAVELAHLGASRRNRAISGCL